MSNKPNKPKKVNKPSGSNKSDSPSKPNKSNKTSGSNKSGEPSNPNKPNKSGKSHVLNKSDNTSMTNKSNKSNKSNNKVVGSISELWVALNLSLKAFIILEINYSTKWGEVDIIAIDYSKLLMKNNDKNISDQYVRFIFNLYIKNLKIYLSKNPTQNIYTFNDIKQSKQQDINLDVINKNKIKFIKFQNQFYKNFLLNYFNNDEDCSLVFVEVKTKTSLKLGSPEQMVSAKKIKHIHRLSTL